MKDPQVAAFDDQRAASYDQNVEKIFVGLPELHTIIRAIFSELPDSARILCVGAGTGREIIDLAAAHPGWRFIAIDPSPSMLAVCRKRVVEAGIEARCEFHEGYLSSLPPSAPYDAATSLLVSHFATNSDQRRLFFAEIAYRLSPRGVLVTCDHTADVTAPSYEELIETWKKIILASGLSPEHAARMFAAYGRGVGVIPSDELAGLISSAGFETPTLVFQSLLLHAWYTRRRASPE